jgi:hypothetical protein
MSLIGATKKEIQNNDKCYIQLAEFFIMTIQLHQTIKGFILKTRWQLNTETKEGLALKGQ